jgi:hypothetical protein
MDLVAESLGFPLVFRQLKPRLKDRMLVVRKLKLKLHLDLPVRAIRTRESAQHPLRFRHGRKSSGAKPEHFSNAPSSGGTR